jgi:hypothetical protein
MRITAVAFAVAIAVAVVPAAASATVFSYTVKLSEKTQTATGIAGDPGGRGKSYITMDNLTNQVCATTEWSGIDDPVGFGHVHAGAYGQPENPTTTIDLFPAGPGVTSPARGCTTALPGEVDRIAACPSQFNTVIHSTMYPVAAIRGQLSGPCPVPPPI